MLNAAKNSVIVIVFLVLHIIYVQYQITSLDQNLSATITLQESLYKTTTTTQGQILELQSGTNSVIEFIHNNYQNITGAPLPEEK